MIDVLDNDLKKRVASLRHTRTITRAFHRLFAFLTRSTKSAPYLAAHIRYNPLACMTCKACCPDNDRKPVVLQEYLRSIKEQADFFERLGSLIDFVYMSSYDVDSHIDIEGLNRHGARPYQFITPVFLKTASEEVEYQVRKNASLKETLVAEFLFDLKMYDNAAAYIGVHSNVWAVLYPLRQVNGKSHSCMYDTVAPTLNYKCDVCDDSFWWFSFY